MYFSTPEFNQYYAKYLTLNTTSPAILVSVNISNNAVISYKLYFEIKHELSNKDILKFLPYSDDYRKYIPYWDSNRESSLCVGLKLNNSTYREYLHIKFESNNVLEVDSELERPKLISIPFLSKKRGVSFEYLKHVSVKKNYFYFYHPLEKKFIKNKFNISDEVDHFEYTEIGDESKVIAVHNTNEIAQSLNFLSLQNSICINQWIDWFKKTFSIEPTLYGIYDNNTVSIYWSFTGKTKELNELLRYKL